MDRLYFNHDLKEGSSGDLDANVRDTCDPLRAVTEDKANLISSLVSDPFRVFFNHAPTLDIDLPVTVAESSPGRHHLFIDKVMPWPDYRMLLDVLATVGIIERGFAEASIAKGASCLRKPGTFKDTTRRTYDPENEVVVDKLTWDAVKRCFANTEPVGMFI